MERLIAGEWKLGAWMSALGLMVVGNSVMAQADIGERVSVQETKTMVQRASCPAGQAFGEAPTSPQEAAKMERFLKQHPKDTDYRLQLLNYYFWSMIKTPSAHAEHERHVFWVIQNLPGEAIAGAPPMSLIPELEAKAIPKAKKLWKEQLAAHPRNMKILENAATFFLKDGSPEGFDLLNRAQTMEPKNPRWPRYAGDVYAELLSSEKEKSREATAKKALAAYERWLQIDTKGREDASLMMPLPIVAFEAGDQEKAGKYAKKLLELAARQKPVDGDAIHKGNTILGRMALRAGDINQAKLYLLASAQTPGSAVLGSFGPNMRLAEEMLAKGERNAVIEYFALCGKFWKDEKLAQWTQEVKAGKPPDFGANVDY